MMCICRRHFFPPLGTPNAVHYRFIRAGSIAGQAAHMEVFFSDLKESAIELTVNAQQRQYSTVQPSQLDRSEVGRSVTGACGLLGHWPWRLRVGLPI